MSLEPDYVPAQIALATAQLAAGDSEAAAATLAPIRDLNRAVGAHLLLSRALLANGDTQGAIEAARREALTDVLHPLEPGEGVRGDYKYQAEELIGMAHLTAGRYARAAGHLLAAAAEGSDSARSTLAGNPNLRQALGELVNVGRLPHLNRHWRVSCLEMRSLPETATGTRAAMR